MRVLIVALGTRGDCQPFACLASALISKGHKVYFCTHEIHKSLTSSFDISGLEVVGVPGDPDKDFRDPTHVKKLINHDFPGIARRQMEMFDDRMVPIARACLQLEPCDVVVSGFLAFNIVTSIAQSWNVPLLSINLTTPYLSSSYYGPTMVLPKPLPFGWMNRLANDIVIKVLFKHILPVPLDNQHIVQREAGVETTTFTQMTSLYFFGCPQITAYSPTLAPHPQDWPTDRVIPCGYFQGTSLSTYHSSFDPTTVPGLSEFLSSCSEDAPPVYIGFGSMVIPDPAAFTRTILKAIKRVGRKTILQAGWAGLGSNLLTSSPEDKALLQEVVDTGLVYELKDPVPHTWLFPQCGAVVHHGGCGTTHTVLASGVPQVIVPVFADQPFWAYRVGAIGVGPERAISIFKINAHQLASRIEYALTPKVRQRAKEVGEQAKKEDGTAQVVELVEKYGAEDGKAFWVRAKTLARHGTRVR